jgi:hypothetical protein
MKAGRLIKADQGCEATQTIFIQRVWPLRLNLGAKHGKGLIVQ